MADLFFYPHDFAEGALHSRITGAGCDNPDLRIGDYFDHDARNLELIGVGGWESLEVNFRIESQNRLVVPESGASTARVFLVCRSTDSRRRFAVELQVDELGVWTGSVVLRRVDWAGSIRITPVAIHEDGRQIASGSHWDIYLDRKDSMPGGFMSMEWKCFSQSQNPQMAARADCGWYWDLENPDKPQLFLNEEIRHLKDVFNVVAHNGPNAMLRNLAVRSLLVPALVELVLHCLHALKGQVLAEASGWKRDVLVAIAGRSRKASGMHVAEEWLQSDLDQFNMINAEIMVGVQRHFEMSRKLGQSLHKLGGYEND